MSDKIGFTKMHGLGNDFVLVDVRTGPNRDWPDLAVKMCDRHFGIGADGLIMILASQVASLRMRIINSDGSEAQMCGNGIRCLAKYAYDRGLVQDRSLAIETMAGVKKVDLEVAKDQVTGVRVDMGPPSFDPASLPVRVDAPAVKDFPLVVAGREYAVSCISMGNPHTIIFTDSDTLNQIDLSQIGPLIEHHEMFPERTNVEFCSALDDGTLRVRVWERGAGITLACGTGACASAVSAMTHGLVEPSVKVVLPGGNLLVEWSGWEEPVYMSGSASYICDGTYYYE